MSGEVGESEAIEVGDKLKVFFEENSATKVEVLKVKIKKELSESKYTLRIIETNEIITTKLSHLKWKKIKNKKMSTEPSQNKKKNEIKHQLPAHKYILAPMVGASELPFRLLCRKYGAQLAYTPMMNSEKFAMDEEYRQTEFQTTPQDRPLVAHFSGNNPDIMLQATKFVEDKCDAIDLNLGCPQRVAFTGHFGSYLLGPEDRENVLNIVKKLSSNLKIPVFVKIRLLDTVEETLELCFQLAEAGASLIAIHARYRVNLVLRTGPGARDGPAYLDQVKFIKKEFLKSCYSHIPIIANGNIITHDDVVENLNFTNADGVMSAEGILDNPAIFFNSMKNQTENRNEIEMNDELSGKKRKQANSNILNNDMKKKKNENDQKFTKNKDSDKPTKIQLALEYLEFVEKYPATLKTTIFHIRRMCRDELTKYELLEDCLNATDTKRIYEIICQMKQYEEEGGYELDQEKIRKAREAMERLKQQEGKRKEFEKRMIRKAKREGKELDFYLNIGAELPTIELLNDYRKMTRDESFNIWKEKHSQHCYPFHIFHHSGMKKCDRDRTCAFLHMDPSSSETKEIYG